MSSYPPPTPDPFDFPGGSVGVLLIHGFTGSSAEMRPMGQYLAGQGYTALGPLLPGHGTRWQDLASCKWTDWTSAAERVYIGMKERCHTIFVGGGSMGALITLFLAERHPEIAGIIAMAPALFAQDWRINIAWLLKRLRPFSPYDPQRDGDDLADPEARQRYLWSYMGTPLAAAEQLVYLQRLVQRRLHEVVVPTLILQSKHDRTVKPSGADYAFNRISSCHKELVWLPRSGHCLWVDIEKEQVWLKAHQFIATHAC